MSEEKRLEIVSAWMNDNRNSSPRLLNGAHQPIHGEDYSLHPVAGKTIELVSQPVPINHGTGEASANNCEVRRAGGDAFLESRVQTLSKEDMGRGDGHG